ncbi:DUF4405 domain-containing protein [Bacillus sp. ISL-40]|uniref:DUF4405 domain-containing protein n=1 Tax=unclassified Bacillus (in: firmicutes) TaxID=185979 RepID=UPI001BE926FA|nr:MULTISPECIES: DUF4405 domain-containing protein [unclassified Bacillus (in: firmicutes)]MBT2696432.1 DUF4405 domain-containing protein [Bacillus sp. ISL-40]MBT2741552.1 DUF4405 domain-containing protein [Bacillus sp. ISL-77]
MNRNMLIRLAIDLAMTVLTLVAMAYQITGNTIHELVGVLLLLLFIAHNILNRRWYKTIFKGKHNVQRKLSIAVNSLFLVSMIMVMISSVPISRDIFAVIPINNDMILLQIHVMSSYWGFIFMAVHIRMSWGKIINAVRKMTGITSTSRIHTTALRVIAVLIVVYGVQTSFESDMLSRLTLYNPFGWSYDESNMGFLIEHLSIMGIYISGTHYVLKFVQKQDKTRAYTEQ